jgi:hypothetical protein
MRVARLGVMLTASVQLPVTYRCTLRSFFLTMLAWLARRNVTPICSLVCTSILDENQQIKSRLPIRNDLFFIDNPSRQFTRSSKFRTSQTLTWHCLSYANARNSVKKLLSRAPPCFGRLVKPLVPAAFAIVSHSIPKDG